jgi:hypothetical protein
MTIVTKGTSHVVSFEIIAIIIVRFMATPLFCPVYISEVGGGTSV